MHRLPKRKFTSKLGKVYKVLFAILIAASVYAQNYDSYILTPVTKTDSDSLWQMINEELGISRDEYELEFDEMYIGIWYSEDDGRQFRVDNIPKEVLNVIRKRKATKI